MSKFVVSLEYAERLADLHMKANVMWGHVERIPSQQFQQLHELYMSALGRIQDEITLIEKRIANE